MKTNDLIREFQERGLIAQITNEKALSKKLGKSQITLYCGFDPTADSLHLGHLFLLMCLKRFQKKGHKPIALIGGATGLIGDPSFKSTERKLHSKDVIEKWICKIREQITLFLDFNQSDNSAVIINNYDWFSNVNVLSFLRDIGKHFSINQMLNREAVKLRLNRNNYGISFTEFSYSLLQGYDFAFLNKSHNVVLQIGGSDQWGNIITGIELTRRLYQKQVFGLTIPLITKTNGIKFSKTENNTIWLDPKKTSPYKFYQFWINTSDSDVYRFLNFFTLMDIKIIHDFKPPHAQYVLAEYVTKLVHGEKGLASAKRITNILFKSSFNTLRKLDFEQLVKDGIPMIEMQKGSDLIQALLDSKLQPSRYRARNAIFSNAITVNDKKQNNPEYIFTDIDRVFGHYTLIRHGKKNHCLIYWK